MLLEAFVQPGGRNLCAYVCVCVSVSWGEFKFESESVQQYNPLNLVHNSSTFLNGDTEKKGGYVMENELLDNQTVSQGRIL